MCIHAPKHASIIHQSIHHPPPLTHRYKFMRKVILPDATQKDMYRAVAAQYDEAVTMQLVS